MSKDRISFSKIVTNEKMLCSNCNKPTLTGSDYTELRIGSTKTLNLCWDCTSRLYHELNNMTGC